MKTFGDFRRSRFLLQGEAAELLGTYEQRMKRLEHRLIGPHEWDMAQRIDQRLEEGPHSFITVKYLDPVSLAPMSYRTRTRLAIGKCFVAFGYYEPDDVQITALRMRRPDLAQFARENGNKRLVVLYRVGVTRYARDMLRKGYGVTVADIRLPSLAPLRAFEPGGHDAERAEDVSALRASNPAIAELDG